MFSSLVVLDEDSAGVMRNGGTVGVTSRPQVTFILIVLGKSCGRNKDNKHC